MAQWMARHAAGVVVLLFGGVVVLSGVVVTHPTEVVIARLIVGAALLFGGGALARLRELDVTPTSAKMRFDPTETTLGLAGAATGPMAAELAVIDKEPEIVAATRWFLAGHLLEDVLQPNSGPLAGSLLQLFLHDADDGMLGAVSLEGHPPSLDRWRPGCGATGTAWAREEYVLATGDAVWDSTHGLTEEQQKRYRHLTAVAAMPVTTPEGAVIGVLTAMSDDASIDIGTDEAFEQHMFLAEICARVLIDILKWFTDSYDEE